MSKKIFRRNMNIYDDSQSGNSNGMAIVIEPILNILILWWNVSHENKRTKSNKKVWEKKEKREQNIIFSYLHRQRNAFCDVVKTILCSIFLLFFLFFLGTVIICYLNEREPHFKIPSKDYVQESPFCYYISIVNINRWTSKHIHSRFLLQKPFRREKVRQTKRARSSLKQFRFASDVLPAPAFFRKNFFVCYFICVCLFFLLIWICVIDGAPQWLCSFEYFPTIFLSFVTSTSKQYWFAIRFPEERKKAR